MIEKNKPSGKGILKGEGLKIVRKILEDGRLQTDIASEYGVSVSAISYQYKQTIKKLKIEKDIINNSIGMKLEDLVSDQALLDNNENKRKSLSSRPSSPPASPSKTASSAPSLSSTRATGQKETQLLETRGNEPREAEKAPPEPKANVNLSAPIVRAAMELDQAYAVWLGRPNDKTMRDFRRSLDTLLCHVGDIDAAMTMNEFSGFEDLDVASMGT